MTFKKASFKDHFEVHLAERLSSNEDGSEIVRWAGEQLLQSYKNGIEAGRKGASVIRKGKSRRHPVATQTR